MKEVRLISLTPEELSDIVRKAIAAELSIKRAILPYRHAYTIAEVCQHIGYSRNSVSNFIREGRIGRNGNLVKLKAREVTKGDYRITPQDLDDFICHF